VNVEDPGGPGTVQFQVLADGTVVAESLVIGAGMVDGLCVAVSGAKRWSCASSTAEAATFGIMPPGLLRALSRKVRKNRSRERFLNGNEL